MVRYGIIPIALFGWLGHELVVKKKRFDDIKNDLVAALFLAAVYLLFAYLIFR
jgi:hypothetical protein